MNRQIYATSKIHCYRLQPGDGTQYVFGFMYPDQTDAGIRYDTEPDMNHIVDGNIAQKIEGFDTTEIVANAFLGLGEGQSYVMFYVDCGGGTAFTYIDRLQLKNLTNYVISGVHSRLRGIDRYSVVAVLLALEILVEEPRNVMGATFNMLNAPDYMKVQKEEKNGR